MMVSALAVLGGGAAAEPVLELRQYKLVPGKREAMVALFDREFVETQEAHGMRIVGQFESLDDPNRFVWLREFPSAAARAPALTAFYFGPVWQAHRDVANPMLEDNDNVLMLRPAAPGLALPPNGPRSAAAPRGLVVAHIYHLWKDPAEGFADFFAQEARPALEAAGLPVLGAYAPEASPNEFPRLPVRQGEKVFVWFTRAPDVAAYDAAMRRLEASPAWRDGAGARLRDALEREPQVLRLRPTPRSALR